MVDAKIKTLAVGILIGAFVMADAGWSQPRQPRPHTVTQSNGQLDLEPAIVEPPAPSEVEIAVEGVDRLVRANGLPDHLVGRFPNANNRNEIAAQSYLFDLPAEPKLSGRVTPLGLHNFGFAIDGVPFDPGAAEWYLGDRNGWRYAALSGAIPLGLDQNFAHVQPTGAYHYHGIPVLLLEKLGVSTTQHSPLVGWAADGFPIYAIYGYANADDAASPIEALSSSYRLKSGSRPSGGSNPGGVYDGTFIDDYEYVAGAGDLDECNGRMAVTPSFPEGTYAYFLTENWPVIPRCFKGTPSTTVTEERAARRR